MKCPLCGVWSEVLDTRAGVHDSVRRRRQCGNGHRFVTYEVTEPSISSRELKQTAAFNRRRAAKWQRDRAIIADSRSYVEIAREYKLTAERVGQIKRAGRSPVS